MNTIYLRFSDRADALAVLASVLGYESTARVPGGMEEGSVGWCDGVRYDLCFLSDQGVASAGEGDLVNVQWWGEGASAPDFGGHGVTPSTPRCGFAA
jgi:hypothetical protein